MFSREEASKLRQQFWIKYGRYMKPILNAEGEEINWVNYKTGVKHIFFRLDAEQKFAKIAIEIAHPDAEVNAIIFEQLLAMKAVFADAVNEEWDWVAQATNGNGKSVARVELTLEKVSVFNQQQWPDIISFLKPRIIALDAFWCDVKPIFKDLVSG